MKALRCLALVTLVVAGYSAESKKEELPPLPAEFTLASGAVIRKVSVVRWEKDRVVVKHAGGVDPVRYANLSPTTQAIVLKHRDVALRLQAAEARNAATEAQERQAAYTQSFVDQQRFEKMAKNKQIALGMPVHLLVQSWGNPIRKNTSSSGPEQWVYGGGQYVYVEHGKIRSWQASH